MNSAAIYIYRNTIHHLDQPTGQSTEPGARAPERIRRRTEPARAYMSRPPPGEPNASAYLDRGDESMIESIGPARTRPHVTQPFFGVVQSFYYIISHFTAMNSIILLH
jgi:hypothetical protein